MTRRKEHQARLNLALAARRTVEAEERVTRVGFASVSRVEAARRDYGVMIAGNAVDEAATRAHRTARPAMKAFHRKGYVDAIG